VTSRPGASHLSCNGASADQENEMKANVTRAALVAAIILGTSGAVMARGGGGGDSGSGLNPYSELSGNGRTGGVNSGNYAPPQYNTYLQAYGPYGPQGRPVRERYRPAPRPYYGYPY
jgi:hypothetical protein